VLIILPFDIIDKNWTEESLSCIRALLMLESPAKQYNTKFDVFTRGSSRVKREREIVVTFTALEPEWILPERSVLAHRCWGRICQMPWRSRTCSTAWGSGHPGVRDTCPCLRRPSYIRSIWCIDGGRQSPRRWWPAPGRLSAHTLDISCLSGHAPFAPAPVAPSPFV